MPRIFKYSDNPPLGQNDDLISNGGSNTDVQVSLFRNGVATSAFGFLDGAYVKGDPLTSTGNDSLTSDEIILDHKPNPTPGGIEWRAAVIWDEQTQTNFGGAAGTYQNLWIPTGSRYGLPSAPGTTQVQAFDIITGSSGDDLVKLDYNAANGGIAYTWDISVFGGAGRDIIVSGEGNDWLDGGTETSGLGDGIWGQGGNDTIFGGLNANASVNQNDDLFGGSGNDSIYGSTLYTDEIWGDEGNDVLYGSSFSAGVMAANSGADTIYGGAGDDTMIGGDGADRFFGGNGTDPFASQPNTLDTSVNDTVSFEFASAGVIANLETRAGTGGEANGDQYTQIENLTGSNFADTLTGSSTLSGAGFNVLTQSINNTLSGLAGNDSLAGGAGDDVLFGGADDDALDGGDGADRLSGDAGADVITGGIGSDTIYGGDNNDSLSGNADSDVIFGGLGGDTVGGGSSADTLYGGALGEGNWITYASTPAGVGGIGVTLNIGNNSVSGAGTHAEGDVIANFDNIIGSGFADSLTGNSGANTIYGGGGVDTIRGGNGADSMVGGGEGDWLDYTLAGAGVTADLLTGVASGGHATGDTFSGFANLIGSENDDSLTGDNAANTIYGSTGNDTIKGGVGGDSLAGGGQAGDFVSYIGSATGVTLNLATNGVSGGDGTGDTISGFLNAIGSSAADSISGTGGVNTIFGRGGNDTIEGGAGGDSLDGGSGTGDFVSYANSASGVNITLVNNVVANGDAAGDTLLNFENIIGSGAADGLTGDNNSNTIYGGTGVDTVDGLGGTDTMYGGGDGDFLNYGNSGSSVTVNLTAGTAGGGLGSDLFFGFQHILGSNSNDVLIGDTQANSLVGAAGADSLYGGLGTDSLFGGDGNDVLRGEDGLDTLFGGNNDDLLILNGDLNLFPVSGWDGDTGSAPIAVAGPSARSYGDSAFGGSGIDTVDLSAWSNANTRTVFQFNNWNTLSPVGMAGIEIIIAGSAADIINLTFNDGVTRSAYGENVTIYAAGGADLVFSGSGADLIVGGQSVASTDAGDTLYGGQGNDLIYGDDFNIDNTTGGGDTLYGGGGNTDTVIGGGGNDVVYDNDGGLLYGGHGDDVVVLIGGNEADDYLASGGFVEIGGSIHPNAATDGNDRVFVGGSYNSVQSDLGAGNDSFIASSDPLGTGFKTDVVTGGTGSDAISSWYGDDVLYGDYDPSDTSGNGDGDALWGGAGSDTIYGGPGQDIIYGGEGNGDLLVGGDGADYYYWARTDGIDRIEDGDTVGTDQGENYIVVIPDFDPLTDLPRVGSGVFETDHDLYDNAGGDDMVQIVDLDGAGVGTMYRMTILQGPGAGSSIEFDQQEIAVIGLWNNDATGGTPVITAYYWDPVDGRYEYQP